jgi:hypothetical protein
MKNIPRFWLFLLGIALGAFSIYFAKTYSNNLNNTSIIPGWHTTVFPPAFWFQGVFSLLIYFQLALLSFRFVFKWEKYYPIEAMERLNLLIFVGAILVNFNYLGVLFQSYRSEAFEAQMDFYLKTMGNYTFTYFFLLILNLLTPLLFWRKNIRKSVKWTVFICLLINSMFNFEKIGVFVMSIIGYF